MKTFFKIFLTLITSLTLDCAFADDAEPTVKLAFLAPGYASAQTSAIFNGARDATTELRTRFGKKTTITFISADNSAVKQLKQLDSLYLQGYAGAIVFPVDGVENKLAASAEFLSKRGFYTAFAGTVSNNPSLAACVATDTKKTAEILAATIKKLSGTKKLSIACYFYQKADVDILDFSEQKILERLVYPNLTYAQLAEVIKPLDPVKMVAMQYYSIYAKQHAVEIARYDNFGEIFFSPQLLADVSPIKKDADRAFAICIGALPQFEFYLSGGMLDACIYDDPYGWGFVGTRALMEKIFAKEPEKVAAQIRLIPPLVATPSNVKNFTADWRKWLK